MPRRHARAVVLLGQGGQLTLACSSRANQVQAKISAPKHRAPECRIERNGHGISGRVQQTKACMKRLAPLLGSAGEVQEVRSKGMARVDLDIGHGAVRTNSTAGVQVTPDLATRPFDVAR